MKTRHAITKIALGSLLIGFILVGIATAISEGRKLSEIGSIIISSSGAIIAIYWISLSVRRLIRLIKTLERKTRAENKNDLVWDSSDDWISNNDWNNNR